MVFNEYRLYFMGVTEWSHIFHECEARDYKIGEYSVTCMKYKQYSMKNIEFPIYYVFYRVLSV